ncbi:LacI family DNA-binding transcriptional regulator [Boseongicola sp. H5]|uniref:LacI family DNA-binding transcriptional regulator n=2 Tax=Boseongicola sp. H5 TaxID=2763261 RepID=UPI001D0AFDD7|nr:LacI family DNA-binding transcriptional regulator [Boseongicola sp. H5]
MTDRTTLKDVALVANVSQMTVSRVVRGDRRVSVRTRDRVQRIIEQIGYVPNKLAGSLAHSRSNQVAVLIPSLVNNVYSQVLTGITEMLERADYNPVVGVTNNDLRKEEALLESMMSWRPAAAILANLTHTDRTTRILRAASIPVVEIMDINGVPIDMSVGFNHIHAAQELADYLIGRGYRRFGYVGWIRNEFAASARYAALRARLERLGYGLVAPDLFKMPPDVPGGKYGTKLLLEQAPNTDVIVYSNDMAAVGGALYCIESGVSVPGKLAIAGFTGLRMGESLPWPLTTIRTFRHEIGRVAGRNVLKALSGTPVQKVTDVGYELVKGGSA